VYADAGDSDDSDDSMEESEESYVSEVSSDTDDEAEKMEKLQLMVMKTAKGITVQDLITPRGTRKKKGKPAEVPKGEDPGLRVDVVVSRCVSWRYRDQTCCCRAHSGSSSCEPGAV
jgi:hypothetical protein